MNQGKYSGLISEEIRRQFHRDGFAIVKNVYSLQTTLYISLKALTLEELEIFRREVDCLVNFLISENIDIMKDFGGVIGGPYDSTTKECFDLPESMDDLETYLNYHAGISTRYDQELDRDEALTQARQSPSNVAQTPSKIRGWPISRSLNVDLNPEHGPWTTSVSFERQLPVLVDIPAGSIIFLSGFVRHCSLGNGSSKFRRAYMPQFSLGRVVGEGEAMVSTAVSTAGYTQTLVPPMAGGSPDTDYDQ
ncbi:hypothetical protein BGZ65_004236 [Modicella reniformis]|uniref:Phytanoyl-CoA dioxygenase n=1 Tax=Modicella reniformis TaxID=1440133 RepID=A0A9P6MHJ8_9FUNG|nr:hypothetical protein BGZ65_004236 [Modicella reniformis]